MKSASGCRRAAPVRLHSDRKTRLTATTSQRKQPEACFMSFSSISIHNVILTIFLPLTVYPLKAISTFM